MARKNLYRFHNNGIRYTVECASELEAQERFERIKREMGNERNDKRSEESSKTGKAMRAEASRSGLAMLNAFDKGIALACRGRRKLYKRDFAGLNATACNALRYGFHSADWVA